MSSNGDAWGTRGAPSGGSPFMRHDLPIEEGVAVTAVRPVEGVLVVGSGQSGVQIVEDLLEDGRSVYVATSAVGRCPRRYRGKDIFEWIQSSGMADQRPEDLPDPAERHARQPQVSGTHGGHTVSLRQIARDGATLLGRLSDVRGHTLHIDETLQANVQKGDEVSARLRTMVDGLIQKTGVEAPRRSPIPRRHPSRASRTWRGSAKSTWTRPGSDPSSGDGLPPWLRLSGSLPPGRGGASPSRGRNRGAPGPLQCRAPVAQAARVRPHRRRGQFERQIGCPPFHGFHVSE